MRKAALCPFALSSSFAFAGTNMVMTLASGKSIELNLDEKGAPKTCARIKELVKQKFFDGIRFHRVEGWVVQWGAPQSKKGVDAPGVGNGGSGKSIPFEAGKLSFAAGVLGMASTGAKVGGDSQMFIVTQPSPNLDGSYCAFGKVVKGMDVLKTIKRGDVIKSVRLKTVK